MWIGNCSCTWRTPTLAFSPTKTFREKYQRQRRRTESSNPTPLFEKPISWHQNAQKWKQFVTESRSEEHTSELQSRENLVCRLLLEKKKKKKKQKKTKKQ